MGQGAFARVLKAHCPSKAVHVAVKIMYVSTAGVAHQATQTQTAAVRNFPLQHFHVLGSFVDKHSAILRARAHKRIFFVSSSEIVARTRCHSHACACSSFLSLACAGRLSH